MRAKKVLNTLYLFYKGPFMKAKVKAEVFNGNPGVDRGGLVPDAV